MEKFVYEQYQDAFDTDAFLIELVNIVTGQAASEEVEQSLNKDLEK